MIAVIFEVDLADGRMEQYLALAAALRSELEAIDGFLTVERFQSMTDPGRMVSLSYFRDEEVAEHVGPSSHTGARPRRRVREL